MKVSKALGFGLLLHVLLIAALVVQPSCMTMDPPTQTYQQSTSFDSADSSRTDSILDPAFNAEFESGSDERFAPSRPGEEFSEFDGVTPKLSPILSDMDSSTVEIAGPSFKIYTVKKGDSLWAISKRHSVSVDDLYAANGLNKSSVLKIGQQIKVPVEGSTATISTITADTYQPSGFNMETVSYTVVKGDTLSKIARRFSTSVNTIKAANNKNSDLIRIGEKLTIPLNSKASGGTQSSLTTQGSGDSTWVTSEGSEFHVVKLGEYPGTIARQYGMTASELLAINGITDPRKIQVGQKLKVVPGDTVSVTKPKVQTAPTITSTAPEASQPPKNTTDDAPVEIRVVEADPLIDSEIEDIDLDSMFENVEEVPVIPSQD